MTERGPLVRDGVEAYGDTWPIYLRAARLELRPLRRSDAGRWDLLKAANYLWLREWDTTVPEEQSSRLPTFQQWIRKTNRRAKRGTSFAWAISVSARDTGPDPSAKMVGMLSLSGVMWGSARMASAGYWIDERHAGRGYVPWSLALATDYCFSTLGLHRMEVAIRPENDKSLRVVEKLGFRSEGLRPAYLHVNGDWRAHAVFALNAEECPEGLVNRLPALPK